MLFLLFSRERAGHQIDRAGLNSFTFHDSVSSVGQARAHSEAVESVIARNFWPSANPHNMSSYLIFSSKDNVVVINYQQNFARLSRYILIVTIATFRAEQTGLRFPIHC